MTLQKHRQRAPERVRVWVATISDTRDTANDTSGALIREHLEAAGHRVIGSSILREDPARLAQEIEALLSRDDFDVLLMTGGTGIAPRDHTYEVLAALYERPIPGFGELFRALSWQEIGSAAMLSRASAGVASGKLVVSLPGSRGAVRLGMQSLVLPELGHLVGELQRVRDPEETR